VVEVVSKYEVVCGYGGLGGEFEGDAVLVFRVLWEGEVGACLRGGTGEAFV
jgi:hypothetical protein